MSYFCEVCDKYVKLTSKYRYFKSKIHNELQKCKHILLSLKDI